VARVSAPGRTVHGFSENHNRRRKGLHETCAYLGEELRSRYGCLGTHQGRSAWGKVKRMTSQHRFRRTARERRRDLPHLWAKRNRQVDGLIAFPICCSGCGRAGCPFDFLPSRTPPCGSAELWNSAPRRKSCSPSSGPQNSLLDADDRPIPGKRDPRGARPASSATPIARMFSLDDETLEKGGESILASKGDLGELLFSASTACPSRRKLLDLRGEADWVLQVPRAPAARSQTSRRGSPN